MRTRLVAVAAALLVLAAATPSAAYLVEVTTSVALEVAASDEGLHDALQAAVDDVLAEAIAFRPTLILLTHAVVVGDRLIIRLLVADDEGERTFRDLHEPPLDDELLDAPDERWI